jgi:hypothetical protein
LLEIIIFNFTADGFQADTDENYKRKSLHFVAFLIDPIPVISGCRAELCLSFQSARGLAHSGTLGAIGRSPGHACVLECGGPPPLFPCSAGAVFLPMATQL